jgi:hypothetical protein
VADGEPDHIFPLVVAAGLGDQVEVLGLNGGLGPEVVLECAVDEVHHADRRLPQQSAAQQQVAEDVLGAVGRRHVWHGRELLADDAYRGGLGRLGSSVADQPVRDPLEQLDLCLLRRGETVRHGDLALLVAAHEQHGERGGIQLHAAVGEMGEPVAVKGADERAHQGDGGQPVQVVFLSEGGPQGVPASFDCLPFFGFVDRGQDGVVPPVDEPVDVVAVHREQVELGEVDRRQPEGVHGGRPGGDEEKGPRIEVNEVEQPAPHDRTFALGDLVHAVDQHHAAAAAQHPVGPVLGL